MDFTFFQSDCNIGDFDKINELNDNLKRLILVLKKINKNVLLITGCVVTGSSESESK